MPRPTRTRKAASPPPSSISAPQLQPSDPNPAELFILPSNASKDSCLVLLPHPATSISCRYLFCPETGFYELTSVAQPKSKHSSCLLAPDRGAADGDNKGEGHDEGYVIEDAKMIVATPFDPLFFLASLFDSKTDSRSLARSLDDHMQTLEASSIYMEAFLRQSNQREYFEALLLSTLSGAGEVEGEALLRADPACLFKPIKQKAQRMTQKGLPRSLAAYSAKQLQVPSLVPVSAPEEGKDSTAEEAINTTKPAVDTEPDVARSTVVTDPTKPTQEISNLNAFRISLDYLIQNYLPPRLHHPFRTYISQHSKIDFTPLDKHLAHVQQVRQEARALRSLSDNISRKRSTLEDDEAAEARAEKRRRKEEEEKRKKAETRAAKDLKKVDTTGMRKMSSFFVKAAAAK